MEFSTAYTNRPRVVPEVNRGESLVEKVGYISAQQRIENMMLAGKRLVDYRNSQFDFPDGNIDEDYYDPTREGNFDMADASQMMMESEENLKNRSKTNDVVSDVDVHDSNNVDVIQNPKDDTKIEQN